MVRDVMCCRVFEPARMSAESLQAGHDWLTAEFYRPWRIARRLARFVFRPKAARVLPYATAINVAYLGRVRRWHIRGYDPAPCRSTPALPARGAPSQA